jgi:hypothetical protein
VTNRGDTPVTLTSNVSEVHVQSDTRRCPVLYDSSYRLGDEDNIKMDFIEIRCKDVDWIPLPPYGVKAVINLRVP